MMRFLSWCIHKFHINTAGELMILLMTLFAGIFLVYLFCLELGIWTTLIFFTSLFFVIYLLRLVHRKLKKVVEKVRSDSREY